MVFTIVWSVILFLIVIIIGLTLRKKENVEYYNVDLWLLTAIVKLVIIVFMYLVLGSFIDHNVWVDTVSYFTKADALANNTKTIGDLAANMEWPPHIGYEILLGYVFKITGSSDFFAGIFNGFLSIIGSLVLYKIGQYVVERDRALKIAALFNLYPLTIHFSLYVLKDISVMLLCELCVLFGLQILMDKRYKSFFSFGLTIFILLFFRSFFAIFAVLWLVICICLQSEINMFRRAVYISIAVAVSIFGANFLSSGEINAGYTIGGADSFLDFVPQMRLTFTLESFSQLFQSLGNSLVLFIKVVLREVLLVLVGPFYYLSPSNIFYIASTNGYRFILFENLGSLFTILLFPGYVYSRKYQLTEKKPTKYLKIFILLFFCSLLLVGDVRWKLSIMPFLILLYASGMFDNSKEHLKMWFITEIVLGVVLVAYRLFL